MPTIPLHIRNAIGLHARPAALFVQTASRFHSEITIQHGEQRANAKSILDVLTLGAGNGAEITVSAEGDDAPQALKALEDLVNRDFGEDV